MDNISKYSNIISFLLISSVYCLISYLSKRFLFSDELYFNNFSNQLSYDKITEIIENKNKISYFSYIFIPILLLIKFTLIAFVFSIYGFLSYNKYGTKQIFRIVIKAEIFILISQIIKFLWFLIIAKDFNLTDIQFFYPLSALSLFDYKNVELFLIYPLQTINLFEFLYWFALAYGISKIIKTNFHGGMKVVLSSYVPALLLWIVFITFLTVNLS
jgi:hypothetical protein